MTAAVPKIRGRPRASPLTRREQLRLAKRAQRARERRAGLINVQVRLDAADAALLRTALARPGFGQRLREFLGEAMISVANYPNLAALCWNRTDRFVTDEEAFRLYERNWRFVDVKRMKAAERELIGRLAARFGKGVLNV
jgi:hypothetical protein